MTNDKILLTPYITAFHRNVIERRILHPVNPFNDKYVASYYIMHPTGSLPFIAKGMWWPITSIPSELEYNRKLFTSIDHAKRILDMWLIRVGFTLLTDEQYAKYQLLL